MLHTTDGCLAIHFFNRNTPLREREVYWDGGPRKIKVFVEQHSAMCGSNWVCTRLGLEHAIVEQLEITSTENPPSAKKTLDTRHSLEFLIE